VNSETSTGKLRLGIARLYTRFWSSDGAVFASTSALVGLGAGLGAILFRWLTLFFNDIFFVAGGDVLAFLGPYYVVLIPAAGGLIVGCLIHFLAPRARGFGLPEVMEAVAFNKGRIRPLYSLVKVTTASICIGTGGSVGIVGPIMQAGSGLGSYLGQKLRLSDAQVRVLVACGAAGGVATTFNAPVAGVFFAMEVILREFSSRSFAMVVIASVVLCGILQPRN
jgi:chloride channel protein, CIC family